MGVRAAVNLNVVACGAFRIGNARAKRGHARTFESSPDSKTTEGRERRETRDERHRRPSFSRRLSLVCLRSMRPSCKATRWGGVNWVRGDVFLSAQNIYCCGVDAIFFRFRLALGWWWWSQHPPPTTTRGGGGEIAFGARKIDGGGGQRERRRQKANDERTNLCHARRAPARRKIWGVLFLRRSLGSVVDSDRSISRSFLFDRRGVYETRPTPPVTSSKHRSLLGT
jgi:hypothetical protein